MQAALIDSVQESPTRDEAKDDLSIAELDKRLEQAVRENERSERLICDYLLAMVERRGFEKFGFSDIYYYAEGRFGFSARKTRYLLSLAQQLRRLPQIKEALGEGRLGWTKASRIARVATPEDELMWLDSALSLSVRELDQKLNEQRDAMGVKIRAWLTQDQAAVWEQALEVCRRLNGEDLDVGRCLDYIAGEFLATYAYLAYQKEEEENSDRAIPDQQQVEDGPPARDDEEAAALELKICPDNDDLPSPMASAEYGRTWRFVLERDAYRCQYPDCGARRELHVHHIVFRSHSGKKGRRRSNSPQNLVTVCVFHHRMIHAGTIGAKGKASDDLTWRRPALMEKAMRPFGSRHVEYRGELARESGPVYGTWGTGVRVWQTFAKPVSEGNKRPIFSLRGGYGRSRGNQRSASRHLFQPSTGGEPNERPGQTGGKRFPNPDLGRKVTASRNQEPSAQYGVHES